MAANLSRATVKRREGVREGRVEQGERERDIQEYRDRQKVDMEITVLRTSVIRDQALDPRRKTIEYVFIFSSQIRQGDCGIAKPALHTMSLNVSDRDRPTYILDDGVICIRVILNQTIRMKVLFVIKGNELAIIDLFFRSVPGEMVDNDVDHQVLLIA